ncbi:MAG: diacylglycerol kinase family lipid kinase [Caldilineae bacterium]|nr:MAG: diacylglycerol kinase family lipid kinase [Caldilineae bacterium]
MPALYPATLHPLVLNTLRHRPAPHPSPVDAVLIRNPVSGNPALQRAVFRALDEFSAAGWEVDVWETRRRGHCRELASQAVQAGYPRIIIAGGDGSIQQTVDGIIQAGSTSVRLGIIPLGTGNVFARDVGLPVPGRLNPDATVQAARIILQGDAEWVDVGLANGHAFLCWAGVGLDALATDKVERHLEFKRRAPVTTYVAEALRTIYAFRAGRVRVVVDDKEEIEGAFPLVVAANISLYARWFQVAPDARLNSGRLNLLIFDRNDPIRLTYVALKLLRSPHTDDSHIIRRQFQTLDVYADPPVLYHLDGDPVGYVPLHVEVLPRRLPIYLDRRRAARRLLNHTRSVPGP